MTMDFCGIIEVIYEFAIPESDYERLSNLISGDEYETIDDFLSNRTSYIVIKAWNFGDDYLRFCRIGALKCLELQNKGYRESNQHWIDFDLLEEKLRGDFYEFTFTDKYGFEETIYIYPIED